MTFNRIFSACLVAAVALVTLGSLSVHAQARPQLQTPPPLASLSDHKVVPVPASVQPAQGASFTLQASTSIVVPAGDAAGVGELLAQLLRKSTGFRYPVSSGRGTAAAGAILLRLGGPASLGREGYELSISADSVRITATQPAGLFYGVQTLRQLLPAGIEAEQSTIRMASAWTVPPGIIRDTPRFAWRGAMLDVSRHFFTVREVKQYIDLLEMYKLNVLHLHLSDDQGWRIQIDSWPNLALIGGSTQVGGGEGGYYTKEDYVEIVEYAAARYITIVPEIDMPGHTNAAIASYPELGCSRAMPGFHGDTQPPGLYTGIRVGWSALCHDREVTWRFVDDVIRELAEITPGPYLHIGGDEVEVLSKEQYAEFVERAQAIVHKYGKRMIGWEEIGQARLDTTSVAQLWRSRAVLQAHAQGAKVVMSPAPKVYLDMRYTNTTELGLNWAGFIELRDAYEWNPATYMEEISEGDILGVEAPLWSETIRNIGAAQYLAIPRLPAVAEIGWSGEAVRSWEGFRARIAAHAARWRLLGMNFYPSPQVDWESPAGAGSPITSR